MGAKPLVGLKIELVPFEDKYAATVHDWYYDVRYAAFFRFFDDYPLQVEDFKNWGKIMAAGGIGLFIVIARETGRAVGLMTHACLKKKSGVHRFGIMLDAAAQHRTYAIECIITLGDYLYQHHACRKMVIEFLEEDKHIHRIAEQGGFTFEGKVIGEALVHGKYADELKYYMMKEKAYELYGSYVDELKKLPENRL